MSNTLNGYAAGNYANDCMDCKKTFIGDKRAVRCLSCAGKVERTLGRKEGLERAAEIVVVNSAHTVDGQHERKAARRIRKEIEE